jgi:serine/threonine protein phosphatase PrpC
VPYFRSDVGSRLAVEAAKVCMTNADVLNALKTASPGKDREQVMAQLKKSILSRWNASVYLDEDVNHFTEEELAGVPKKYFAKYRAEEETHNCLDEIYTAYGSTLIAALQTDTFLLVVQIGDGSCVVVDDSGVFSQPVPPCDKCFLNTTTSLCEENAIDNFRHVYMDAVPAAVLIGTDGIDDCFAGAEKLFDFYRVILTSFTEKETETAKAELIDYFPRLSEKGSSDDISIGVIIDLPLLKSINIAKEETIAENTDHDSEEA